MLGGSHGSREVLASHSVTSSCLFLSAVTDGIPATSEGKIQAALKLEHVDGVDLVSHGLAGSRRGLSKYIIPTEESRVETWGGGGAGSPVP